MKHFKLFCIIMSCLTVSCKFQEIIPPTSNEDMMIELNFTIEGDDIDSKIPTYETDTRINNLYAFVFDSNNKTLISNKQATQHELQNKRMTLGINRGKRDIYLVANATAEDLISFQSIENLDNLKSLKSDLINIEDGNLPMSGKLESITINEYTMTNFHTRLYRLMSRIHLKEIMCRFDGELMTSSLDVYSVYLINTGAYCSYGDPSIEFMPQPNYSLMDNNYATYDPNCSITNARSYAAQHQDGVYMYSYQHNNTSLIVSAKIGSEIMYYTVPLYDLEPNHSYEVFITISGKGSNSPNTPATECTSTITVEDWTSVSRTITF